MKKLLLLLFVIGCTEPPSLYDQCKMYNGQEYNGCIERAAYAQAEQNARNQSIINGIADGISKGSENAARQNEQRLLLEQQRQNMLDAARESRHVTCVTYGRNGMFTDCN